MNWLLFPESVQKLGDVAYGPGRWEWQPLSLRVIAYRVTGQIRYVLSLVPGFLKGVHHEWRWFLAQAKYVPLSYPASPMDVMAPLSPKQRLFMKLHWGFSAKEHYSLQELADFMGITREEARAFREKALEDMGGTHDTKGVD